MTETEDTETMIFVHVVRDDNVEKRIPGTQGRDAKISIVNWKA